MSTTNLTEASTAVTNLTEASTVMTNLVAQTSRISTNGAVWEVLKFIGNNILLILVVAAVIYIWWRWFRPRGKPKPFPTFDDMLRDDVLRTLDPKSETLADGKLNADETLKAVADALVAGRPTSPMPSTVLCIGYEVKKMKGDEVTLTVVTMHRRGSDAIKRKTERTVSWIDVPKKMRETFIMKNEDSLYFSLFERAKEESADEPSR